MQFLQMNLPNMLTSSRIGISLLVLISLLLVPSVPYFIYISAALFGVGALTDLFDGYFARRRNDITAFGEIFDPLADKMLMLGAFVGLLYIQKIDPLAIFLILSREFFVTGIRIYAASQGQSVAASIWGKVKTVMQIVVILLIMIDFPYHQILLWLTVAITLFSGWDYTKEYLKNILFSGAKNGD